MLLRDMYELAIERGIEADPRGKEAVLKLLSKAKKQYGDLKDDEKEEFDTEQLTNPYPDSRISYGDLDMDVRTILVGVDIDTSELLMVKELERSGRQIDLVISHHPAGKSMVRFADVMQMQSDIFESLGIPINVAEGILEERIGEIARRLMPSNHFRVVDAARLLGVPLMSLHTPADNQVHGFVQRHLDEKGPETLDEILKALKEIPEYMEASRLGTGPKILVGSKDSRPGKIVSMMTGGTGGPTKDVEEMVKAGVGTLVEMHFAEDKRKEAQKHHINVVIAGHMASDSVGMNILLDEYEKRGVEVMTCSGIIRISRN